MSIGETPGQRDEQARDPDESSSATQDGSARTNQIIGAELGSAIQAGVIHGDVHIHVPTPAPAASEPSKSPPTGTIWRAVARVALTTMVHALLWSALILAGGVAVGGLAGLVVPEPDGPEGLADLAGFLTMLPVVALSAVALRGPMARSRSRSRARLRQAAPKLARWLASAQTVCSALILISAAGAASFGVVGSLDGTSGNEDEANPVGAAIGITVLLETAALCCAVLYRRWRSSRRAQVSGGTGSADAG